MSDEPRAYMYAKDMYTIRSYKQSLFDTDKDESTISKSDENKIYTNESNITFGPINQIEFLNWSEEMNKKWKELVLKVAGNHSEKEDK